MLKNFVVLLLLCSALALPETSKEVRMRNGAKLTVSGLSAGGFMAQQFGVAFSSQVSGVGVFAGGPYYCSLGIEMAALTTCMSSPWLIDMDAIVKASTRFASEGKIDDLSNLANQKVYLYSGKYDTVVLQGVVEKIEDFYSRLGGKVAVTEYSINAEHSMPTKDYGNPCIVLASPYVSKCDYDGAGEVLRTFYGLHGLKDAVTFSQENIITLKQGDFVPKGNDTAGIADDAYAYIPTGCKDANSACDIHVVFHGCNQNEAATKGAYTVHGGYDGYAEANNIIMLYPQASRTLSNPQGCFDWWGYGSEAFAWKTGSQMATTMNMVEYLSGGGR